jgi:hypothetical protein
MFWYLGVINKAQNPVSPNGQSFAGPQTVVGGQSGDQVEKERREVELTEQQERAEKERQERERLEKEQREIEMKKKESGRRGSLTKAPAHGPPGNGRKAETPIKGPQYEMQHRVMEQEYGGHGPGMPMSRPALSGGGNGQQYPRIQQQAQFQPGDHFYYSSDSVPQNPQQQPHIPPGAMAPVDQLSRHQPPTAVPRQHSTPPLPLGPGPYRSRSPSPMLTVSSQSRLACTAPVLPKKIWFWEMSIAFQVVRTQPLQQCPSKRMASFGRERACIVPSPLADGRYQRKDGKNKMVQGRRTSR